MVLQSAKCPTPPGRRAIPVGAMVEYCPNSSRRLHQFEKFCQEHSSDMHCLREKFGIEIFWLQTLRNWRIWTHQKSILKDQCRRSIDAREERFFFFLKKNPTADGTAKL